FRTGTPQPLPEETLRCTPTGQVLDWRPKSKTVFDLAQSLPTGGAQESSADPSVLRQRLQEVLGLAGGSPAAVDLSEARARHIHPRIIHEGVVEGYPVEKIFFFSEPDVVVTGVLSHPRGVAEPT